MFRGSAFAGAPAVIISDKLRPQVPFGVQSGDVTASRAVVWSRADRPARMIVEYATTESFKDSQRIIGPAAIEPSDFTARIDLADLPAEQRIFYRVTFQDLNDSKLHRRQFQHRAERQT
jgi:alkaline phosphatase D